MLVELGKRGRLPHISAILETGSFGRMSVTIPEISSVSWSSFMTGTQPGEHGIYGFMDLEPGTYKMYFPNFNHLRAPTMWDQLAARGKRSVVINMPATYPARAMDGALISGFVAVDINRAVYPRSLTAKLLELGYRIDVDTARGRQDHEFLMRDLHTTLAARQRVAEYLWDAIDWDLFVVVITGTDRLLHFLETDNIKWRMLSSISKAWTVSLEASTKGFRKRTGSGAAQAISSCSRITGLRESARK